MGEIADPDSDLYQKVFCVECKSDVHARLTDGREIYPHRTDLADNPRWKCDTCGNHVGTHHKHHDESKRLEPLGVIPNKDISQARQHIHALIDVYWKSGKIKRAALYKRIAKALGKKSYHTAQIRSVEEARVVYKAAKQVVENL